MRPVRSAGAAISRRDSRRGLGRGAVNHGECEKEKRDGGESAGKVGAATHGEIP